MESMISLKSSLTKEMERELNKQIRMEALSSYYYLASASWCEMKGYLYSASFLYEHVEEEKMHMMKIFKYVNTSGGHAIVPEITGVKHHYASLREVFEQVLEHEIAVSKSINNLVDFCFTIKDFATLQFLQWYVMEQREEEALARRTIELFDIIGEEGQGLWMIDKEIGKLAAKGKEKDAADAEDPMAE